MTDQPWLEEQDPELAELRQAQQDEYNTWVAKVDIPHGAVLAYRAGDPVPASNVERWKYDKYDVVELTDYGRKLQAKRARAEAAEERKAEATKAEKAEAPAPSGKAARSGQEG